MTDFDFDKQIATAEWLTKAMLDSGALTSGRVVSIDQGPLSMGGHSGGTNFYQITPSYSGDSKGARPSSLLMKAMSVDILPVPDEILRPHLDLCSAELFQPRKDQLDLYQREVRFNEAIRGHNTDLSVMECYGTALRNDNWGSCLLLEDLRASHKQPAPGDPPGEAQCESAVLALARCHAWWWNHELFGSSKFPQVSGQMIDEVIATFEVALPWFEAVLGDRLTGQQRGVYRRVLDGLSELLKRRMIGSQKLTLVHGDAHPGNMLWRTRGSKTETVIFDWMNWHVETGSWDLAYFMAASWSQEQRQRFEEPLLRTYLAALNNHGVEYTWEDLWFDYRLAATRILFLPVLHSGMHPTELWIDKVERTLTAFDDLDCAELL